MLDSSDQQRLHKLLSDTIPVLCKRSLGHGLELSVEAFIGITLSGENASKEVVVVSFKETLLADGNVSSYVWSEVPSSSTDLSPSLDEPIAFSVSESGSCNHTSSPTVDSIVGNDSRFCYTVGSESRSEYNINWDDGKYWAECSEAAMNGGALLTSRDGAKAATGTSASTSLLSYPVKMEENEDGDGDGDEPEDIETAADLENMSNVGSSYENPFTSAMRRYSSATYPRGSANTHPHYLSTASRSLPKPSRGSGKIIHHPGLVPSLSFQRLPSSVCSKPRVKRKKTSFPAVNKIVQSSHSEVNVYVYIYIRYKYDT